MSWAAALGALLSHWRRRPMQLLMLLVGLSLATALWSGVQAINAEARASYDRAARLIGQDQLTQLVHADGRPIAQATYVSLRRAGWLVSPVLEGELKIGSTRLRLIGIDPATLPGEAGALSGEALGDFLPFITPPGLIFVAPETAASLGLTSPVPLKAEASMVPGTGTADIGIAQTLLNRPGEISRLLLAPEQPAARRPLAEIAPDLTVKSPEAGGDISRLTDSFHLNLTAFGFLAFAVGLFIVYSAIGLAFEQRRATFRTLRSLGLSARALTVLLVAELLAFATLAGLAGVALGYLVGSLLLPGVAATLQGLYGASVPGTLTLRPEWWLSGLLIAVLGALAAAAQSLWRVAHMPLLAPAQPRAWARASERALRIQALASLLLFVASVALAVWGSGLVAGFAVLGALLLGAALLLPVVLTLLLSGMERLSRRALAQWFWADSRQQLPGLSLALMALLLALSANIGVGTMVSSFRLTFTGWLDQRLASELYVTARSEAEAAALRDFLPGKVQAVLPIWSVEGTVGGRPAEIYGAADHATYRDNWPLLDRAPDAWDQVARGTGALVNEQMARRDGIAVGDPLVLPGGWSTRVVGIYSDYGNPVGQVIVDVEALAAHYPEVERLRYGLRLPPADVPALKRALGDRFGLPETAMIDQGALKRRSLEIFEQTFSVTAALNVLTLGVAGLAMFASLMTLSTMRLPQLAPVWAMGLTRRQLVWLELVRTLLLALLTLIAALPVGLGLAWVLLAIVNVEAFGWRLPIHIFPSDWLRLGALALLASLISALIPLRRLAVLAPADLLKVFANER